MRSKLFVRIVKNSEANELRELLCIDMEDDFKDLDWTNIEPYWLGAFQDGEMLACCQVLVGMPIGVIEFLCFQEGLNDMRKARIIKMLAKSSIAGLVGAGVSAVASSVPFHKKSFKNILKKKWGSVVYSSGNLLMKKLVP